MSPELIARIDIWAKTKDLTRSAAIRQLIEQAFGDHDTANRKGGDSYDELKRRLGIY